MGSDSAQGAGSPVMFQAMKRITRWLVRETPSEGIVERTIRRSFLGENPLSSSNFLGVVGHRSRSKYLQYGV